MRRKSKMGSVLKWLARNKYGWLFVTPWLMRLLIFYAWPLFSSFYYSFTSYSILQPGEFVGMSNYKELVHDKQFWQAVYNTFYFAVLFVPLNIIVGIAFAVLLNTKVKGMSIYRTVFFLPTIVPHVATAVLWAWLLNPQFGLVNAALALLGVDGPGWTGSVVWSKPSLILMSLWGVGHAVVIYLAGLNDIPQDYYDAAEVDGASRMQKLRRITLPLLTPVIFYNLVMGMIGAFQQFTLPYTISGGQGDPAGSLMFYVMYLYNTGFQYLKMGYASAMAWILFLVIMLFTLLIFATSKKWVHYQGE